MKIAIFHQLLQEDYIYNYAVFKKVHKKWYRIQSVDDLKSLNLNTPCDIPHVTDNSLKPYGCGITYFGDYKLLKSTLPELFI